MAITVGLDFGTHQTKVCIENSDDIYHKTYEFFEWEDGIFALPSVIHINKDHTLTYGKIEEDNCLIGRKRKPAPHPGEFKMPQSTQGPTRKPYPPKPQIKITDLSELNRLKELIAWENECKRIDQEYEVACARYNIINRSASPINKVMEEALKAREYYEKALERHTLSLTEEFMIFRHFKQATFSLYKWESCFEPKLLSVLYLTYVIFRLAERLGNTFSIQMGIPASAQDFNKNKRYAYGYLIQAIRLAEDVFEWDFERFLSTGYKELISLIPSFEYSEELREYYGLIVIPEAYAALQSVTENGIVPGGMNIMMDIGGGTSDLTFFTYNEFERKTEIFHFESLSKGMNFFLEYNGKPKESLCAQFTIESFKNMGHKQFVSASKEYKDELNALIAKLLRVLHDQSIAKGYAKTDLIKGIANRPILYTGGGSQYANMRNSLGPFTDVKFVNKQTLRIRHIVNENRVKIPFSILATAYGLSIQREHDNVPLSELGALFFDKTSVEAIYDNKPLDYGLADT